MTQLPCMLEDWNKVRHYVASIDTDLTRDNAPYIPDTLIEMLISAEDHRFYQHGGYDLRSILRATIRTLSGHPEGGSTIAQQLARIATGRFERSLKRKIREIRLAVKITNSFPKSRIPAIYLAVAYYGWRMNGLSQAYHRLDINAHQISKEQAAALVARLKYPQPREAPPARIKQITQRTAHIIRLHKLHWNKNQS